MSEIKLYTAAEAGEDLTRPAERVFFEAAGGALEYAYNEKKKGHRTIYIHPIPFSADEVAGMRVEYIGIRKVYGYAGSIPRERLPKFPVPFRV